MICVYVCVVGMSIVFVTIHIPLLLEYFLTPPSLFPSVHVGIDDARNTAKLCYRMVRDGCRLDITKCIQYTVSQHS